MAAFGDEFSIELGGGPSRAEAIYNALWSAVGEGNRGERGATDSIVEAWRMALASGLAVGWSADERAALQAQPATATDALPDFEDRLGIHFPLATSAQERRDALQPRHVRRVDASRPALLARAQALNPAAQVLTLSRTLTRDTQLGRAFEDHDPSSERATGPAFGIINGSSGSRATSVPNYSTDHVFVMQSPKAGATFSQADALVLRKTWEMLDEELPAWVDIRVFASCGFTLDLDLLDATAFC